MGNDTTTTDVLIIKLLASNDPKSISILIDVHYKAVFKRIRPLSGNEQDAEEILQDVFLTIWEKRRELKLIPPLRPYLVTMARNKAINLLKLKKRKEGYLSDIDSESFREIPAAPEAASHRQMNKELRLAVRGLPRKTRIHYILSRNFGMTNREIAERLNLSIKTVEKHMTKAIRLIKKALTLSHLIFIYWTFKN